MRCSILALLFFLFSSAAVLAAPESRSISINLAAESSPLPVTGSAGVLGTAAWNNLPGPGGRGVQLTANEGNERFPTDITVEWEFAGSFPNNRITDANENNLSLMSGRLEGPGELRLLGLDQQFVHGFDLILYTFGSEPGSPQTYTIQTLAGTVREQQTMAPLFFNGEFIENENFIVFRDIQSSDLRLNVFSGLNGIEIDGADYHCLAGDFNNDGDLDGDDFDDLTGQIKSGEYDECYDLNSDGIVDPEDGEVWVNDIAQVPPGDANLDGEFNSQDLIQLFATNEYEDDVECNSGWADGDFNNDGEFDSSDLIAAFGAGYYENGPLKAVAASATSAYAVPEASSSLMVIIGGLCLAIRSRARRS